MRRVPSPNDIRMLQQSRAIIQAVCDNWTKGLWEEETWLLLDRVFQRLVDNGVIFIEKGED